MLAALLLAGIVAAPLGPANAGCLVASAAPTGVASPTVSATASASASATGVPTGTATPSA